MYIYIYIYIYNTEFAKYIWNLKNKNIKLNIHWKVVDKVYGNADPAISKLCLTKKLKIIKHINPIKPVAVGQYGKKVKHKSQKVLETNSYVCRSYRRKTGRDFFFCSLFPS